jgi:hypothetical protein
MRAAIMELVAELMPAADKLIMFGAAIRRKTFSSRKKFNFLAKS